MWWKEATAIEHQSGENSFIVHVFHPLIYINNAVSTFCTTKFPVFNMDFVKPKDTSYMIKSDLSQENFLSTHKARSEAFLSADVPILGPEMRVPNTTLLLDGEYHRLGYDLLIVGPNGE